MTETEFEAMLEEQRQKMRERRALADRLAQAGKPVQFDFPTLRQRALAQLDMAGDDVARLTTFDQHGPIGHLCFGNLVEAIEEALKYGGIPDLTFAQENNT